MLRVIGNDVNLPRQEPVIASGTVSSGLPVLMNADGTAGGPFNATTIFAEETSTQISIATNNSGTFVIMHTGPGGSYALRVTAGTISGSTVTLGSSVNVGVESNVNAQGSSVVYDPDNDKFVIFYPNGNNSYYLTSRVVTVSGTTPSLGTAVVVDSRNVTRVSAVYDTSANKVVVAWRGISGSNVVGGAVGTVSGTSISFGSNATLASRTVNTSLTAVYDANANKTAVFYQDSSTGHGYYVVATVSGTSISGGTTAAFHAAATDAGISAAYDPDSNKIVIVYGDGGNNSYGTAIVGTISGTSMSFGSEAVFDGVGSAQDPSIAYDTANNKFFIFYDRTYGLTGKIGTVSGTSISFGSENIISSANITDTGVVYDASAGKALVVYRDTANSSYGTLQALDNTFALTNFTSESYIGISRGTAFQSGSAAATGTAVVFEAAQTNPLDITYDSNAGKVVIAYKDHGNSNYGTAIVGTADASDNSISFGSAAVFESAAVNYTRIVYDANAQKVVIVYRDEGNSNYGTAIVGTVSGTNISFGTPAVYSSAASLPYDITFDSTNNKVVIAYRHSDNTGYGIVGTVSGTNISFGSATQFNSGNTGRIRAAYDTNAQRVVFAYEDAGNSSHGTAVVGTVSGTSISFGSEVVFEAATSSEVGIAYDTDSQKIVIGYRDQGDSNIGKAIVGTVSGTSISFGTAAAFGAGNDEYITVVYNSDAQKIVVAYRDSSTDGKLNVGTVSGTSITFGTETQFESGNSNYVNAAYDSVQKRVVIAYQDAGNSNYGTAIVFKPGDIATTRAQVAGGKTIFVDTQGAISKNQIGLTAGQSYFVQSDGTIGTTAADPSVFAGTAISATELIVKG